MTKLSKYISYLFPITLEKTSSVQNQYLEVVLSNGKKVLNTKDANFSFGSLHKVFQFAFSEFPINLSDISSVLILGFGAGSVKRILRNELKYKGGIVGVEHDKTIISLAEKHFCLDKKSENTIIEQKDVLNYLATCKQKFDLIVIDLFQGLEVPKQFMSPQFLKQIKNSLNWNGVVLYNIIAPQITMLKFKQTITDLHLNYELKQVKINKIKNNIVLIN